MLSDSESSGFVDLERATDIPIYQYTDIRFSKILLRNAGKMLPWMCYILLAVALAQNLVLSFPQNGGDSFEANGFVFDGPADRPPSRRLPSTIPSTTIRTTTTSSSTTGLESQRRFDSCLTSCPVTPEYNPVCGTDNVLYNNPGSLNCAAFCGKSVTVNHYGPCMSGKARG